MSSATQIELTLAEGLLGALGDPAGRALETARRLLGDDSLDEAGAREALASILTTDPKLCPTCGSMKLQEGVCGDCGHLLKEADAKADFPSNIGEDGNLPPKKRRKRKPKKMKEAKMDEATVAGGGATPWGGAAYIDGGRSSVVVPVAGGSDADTDFQGRTNIPADRALLDASKRSRPPNLRDADGWARCGNCVFFGKDECNLYGYGRDGEKPELVHRGGWIVDVDDVCDSHLTLSPQATRLAESLDREDARLAEAARAENAEMIRRSRARVQRAEERLAESVGGRTARRETGEAAQTFAVRLATELKAEEAWSEAARAASAVARRTHLHELSPGDKVTLPSGDAHTVIRHDGEHTILRHDASGERVRLRSSKTVSARAGRPSNIYEAAARETLREVSSEAYPGLDRSPKENWVDKAGGLPRYIERIAKHLHYEKGKEIGHAIAIAVNVVKKMCASGDTNFPGKQNVNAKSRSEACAAVADWEAKKGKAKGKKVAESVWEDFPSLLEMCEAEYRPGLPSWPYIENLHEELSQRYGREWMLGLAQLDEADGLLERYEGSLEEVTVTLVEGIATLMSQKSPVVAAMEFPSAGHWDPLKHPRAAKGRRGGGEFSRSAGVLKGIEARARGRGGAVVGSRDRQRGYKHPADAPAHERTVAEMFDKPSAAGQMIYPAERRALAAYLRRRGAPDFAAKLEQGSSRMISAEDSAHLARHLRGEGKVQTIFRPDELSMDSLAGEMGKRNIPPIAEEFPSGRRKRNPSDGGADKGGSDADRVAVIGVPGFGMVPSFSVEDIFQHDNTQHHRRRNEAIGGAGGAGAGSVDEAIGNVLGGFPGLKDWSVEKQGDAWHVHVEMHDGGKHVIAVDSKGKTSYLSGPNKPAKSKPSDKAKFKPGPTGLSSILKLDQPVDEPAPAATLSHSLKTLSDFVQTGESEKPYHMKDGQHFLGEDGVLYEKLASGPKLMMGKKGPLAGSQIKNHQTGTTKMVPGFVNVYYDLLEPKGSKVGNAYQAGMKVGTGEPAYKSPDGDDLFDKLKQSVGGGGADAGEIKGKHFVITGTIPGLTRPEAEAKLTAAGGIKHSSVSHQVDLLITGDNVGKTKTNKAASYGVKVVPWHKFPHLQEAVVEAWSDAAREASKLARRKGFAIGLKKGDRFHLDGEEHEVTRATAKARQPIQARKVSSGESVSVDKGTVVEFHPSQDDEKKRQVRARLSAATDTMEIVRLRARRDALEEVFDQSKHPRGHGGQFGRNRSSITPQSIAGASADELRFALARFPNHEHAAHMRRLLGGRV